MSDTLARDFDTLHDKYLAERDKRLRADAPTLLANAIDTTPGLATNPVMTTGARPLDRARSNGTQEDGPIFVPASPVPTL